MSNATTKAAKALSKAIKRRKRKRTLRNWLREAQCGICPYCGRALAKDSATIEHVMPEVFGGADDLGNLLTTHAICNSRKGGRLPRGCEIVWLLAVNCRLDVQPQFVDQAI